MAQHGVLICSGAASVAGLLPYPELISSLRSAFGHSHSQFCVPPRQHHSLPVDDGAAALLVMPAWHRHHSGLAGSGERFVGVKIASVFPSNGAAGLPSVSAFYVLMSARDGRVVAAVEGRELTLRRTACASAVAAGFLARNEVEVIVMVGAGALAPHLIRAHLVVRPSVKEVVVWNRNLGKAQELADSLSRELPALKVGAFADLEAAVRHGDIVSCATLSDLPLVKGAWLKPGTHLDLVGSFKPSMMECDDDAVRMSRVFVDTEAAIAEAGELVGALERKAISREHVVGTLAELAEGTKAGRQNAEEMTLFKSVGCALEDLVAAQLLYETHMSQHK